MPSKLSALILQRNSGITLLRGDWRNHARDATSSSSGRRPSLRFRLTMLEWRSQAASNSPTFTKFLCLLSTAVARSPLASLPYPLSCTSGLWMTSHLHIMAGNRGTRKSYTLNDSVGSSMYLILQRVLKLTHQRAARDRGRSVVSTIASFSYHFFHCIIRGIITIASISTVLFFRTFETKIKNVKIKNDLLLYRNILYYRSRERWRCAESVGLRVEFW